MNRLARVVAKNHRSVVLELIKAESCDGCPINCNKPLLDFFALGKNRLLLSINNQNYQLVDDQKLLSETKLLGQVIKLDYHASDLMKSSVLMYFIPVIIILLSLSVGHILGRNFQLSTDFTAALGVVAGFLIIQFLGRKKNPKQHLKFRPKVTISSFNGT